MVNSLCVLSNVAPRYAPLNRALIEATVISNPTQADSTLETAVRAQLEEWFGSAVSTWRHLRTYRIVHALPMQLPPVSDPTSKPARIRPRLFSCGEYRNVASIQWGMVSGRQAAEAVIDGLEK